MSSDAPANAKDELTVHDPSKSESNDANLRGEGSSITSTSQASQSRSDPISPPDVSTLSLHPEPVKRHPAALRSISDTGPPRAPLASSRAQSSSASSGSSSPLAAVQAARTGRAPSTGSTGGIGVLPAGMQAKMMAFHASRSSRSSSPSISGESSSPPQSRPGLGSARASAPSASGPVTGGPVFGQVRPPLSSPRQSGLNRRAGMGMKLSNVTGSSLGGAGSDQKSSLSAVFGSDFQKWAEIVDTQNSRLRFSGKAILHSEGVDFSSGQSFSLRLSDLLPQEELGKGNYGTVMHVIHRVTNAHMAMKQIKLELDNSKFMAIITELQVLHNAKTDLIVDFYGGFFAESCVFICMEYMDGGSLDKLVPPGVGIRDEKILSWVTSCTVRGLKYLKESLNIIHRDVKPTNILANTKGDIKLCDFGVSGNLVASLAKTNIGCQSYMAPERIRGDSAPGASITYSVQSDIWSLGLSILEIAKGVYPYPPETYNSVFAQLSAIVDGDPPELPEEFSEVAQQFVRQCLQKIPRKRPTFNALVEHPWLLPLSPTRPDFPEIEAQNKEMIGKWVTETLEKRKKAKEERGLDVEEERVKPPLHTVKKEETPA